MGLEQAYVARTWKNETSGWVVKAGKLSSAFGAPRREYDDMQNPLLDQPLSFISPLPLYPTLNVCPGAARCAFTIAFHTITFAPMTLYGVWGGEVAGWWKHLDGRAQVSNSSPMNPQPLASGDQHAQWALARDTPIDPAFRVGVSGFRGRWLNGITARRGGNQHMGATSDRIGRGCRMGAGTMEDEGGVATAYVQLIRRRFRR